MTLMKGTIRPHGDGAWRVSCYAGVDPVTGKERQLSKVVRGPRTEAETELAGLVTQAAGGRGGGAGRSTTLAYALEAFLDHKAVSLEATTLDTYRHQLAFIPARLKAMPVGKLQVEHLESLYARLRREGRIRDKGPMSPKSVRHVHNVIYGALELARRRRWISENPAADAEVPADHRREPTPTPADAIVRIIAASAACHPAFPAYVRLSVCAGGRRSEVHGLRWAGIDWDRRRVTIREVIVRGEGGWLTKPYPKTGGKRTITIDAGTLDTLRAVQATALDNALACGIALPDRGFVFSDEIDGAKPWNPRTTAKWFQRACAAVGVAEGTRLHDMRHLMCTHLVDEGLPLPAVAGRAGHTSPNITLDVYSGAVPRSDEVAADIMGRLLDG